MPNWRKYIKEVAQINEDEYRKRLEQLNLKDCFKFIASYQVFRSNLSEDEINSLMCPATMSTKELASRLELSHETFRDYLYMDKPLRNIRDLLAAICVILGINGIDAEIIFEKYKLPVLDPDRNTRDRIIYDLLPTNYNKPKKKSYKDAYIDGKDEKIFIRPYNIEEINNLLEEDEIPPLTYGKMGQNHSFDSPYEVLMTIIEPDWEFDLFSEYDSIEEDYAMYKTKCNSMQLLRDRETNITYEIFGNGYCREEKSDKYITVPAKSKLHQQLVQLTKLEKLKTKKLRDILNDTKYYIERYGAGVNNGTFHIYAETFCYSAPELEEYYFMDYSNNKYTFGVYLKSNFMKAYLGNDYKLYYPQTDSEPIMTYDSFDDIQVDNDYEHQYEREAFKLVINCRKKAYLRLRELIDKCKGDIINRRRCVRSPDIYFDYPFQPFKYYDVMEEYKCHLLENEEYEIYVNENKTAFFEHNNKVIEISENTLKRAFELGFNNIKEICSVLEKYENIDDFINGE